MWPQLKENSFHYLAAEPVQFSFSKPAVSAQNVQTSQDTQISSWKRRAAAAAACDAAAAVWELNVIVLAK